ARKGHVQLLWSSRSTWRDLLSDFNPTARQFSVIEPFCDFRLIPNSREKLLAGPAPVDRLRRVRRDLQVCAMVVVVAAVLVESVFGHELSDLQSTMVAI